MEEANFVSVISRYVPVESVSRLWYFFENNVVNLKVTQDRTTKYGDFRYSVRNNDVPQITVNGGLNQYSFLITLLHEIAHYNVHKYYERVSKPHGLEWKKAFQETLAPYINSGIFPRPLEYVLRIHMQNPRASTHGDQHLVKVLNTYDAPNNNNLIYLESLQAGQKFALNGRVFYKGIKRRTRYMCIEINTNKKYTINALANVEIL